MSKTGNRYSDEFKQQIVELYNAGKPVSALSSEYGVATVTIYKWINNLSPIKVSEDETMSAKDYQSMKKRIAELEMENEILKKGYRHIRKKTLNELVKFITKYREKYTVKLICKVLKFPRSTYYKALLSVPSKRILERQQLQEDILKTYYKSKKRYGAPKIHKMLLKDGKSISLKRVQRYMASLGIRSIVVKKYKPLSSKAPVMERENLLNQAFDADTINQKWCTDITYIHTIKDGWTYLASVMDLYSKKIMGYAYGQKMTSDLAIKAVENACLNVEDTSGIIIQTDLGTQYTSHQFMNYIARKNMLQSFSGKGNPYDNACIESFHSVLKKEEVHHHHYYDFNIASKAIFEYIESWYNRERIHSAVNYMTPQSAYDAA
ncbi:IS3 family transposase [Vallitalea pronyensis]|uniref:IS3 family transposase n=1 Tax=Vallitalea pronyensis TaxID=1348613 RepID=UPI001FECBD3A|nr:IS3 family transposase [Vallitalea pronyensis]